MFIGTKLSIKRKINNQMDFNLKSEFILKNPNFRLYNLPIPLIGLTGGISTGKSTVAEILKAQGFQIISADKLVKSIYATKEAYQFVQNNYPQVIENNQINFKKYRELVFSDSRIKSNVEQFIYSKMPKFFNDTLKQILLSHPNTKCIIYDVPLLFEKSLDKKVDLSVCVYLPRHDQINRLMLRDNISKELAEKILNEQIDIDLKKSKANAVIDNSGDEHRLKAEVLLFINKYFN